MTRLTPEERRLLEQEQATQDPPRQATPAREVVEARAGAPARRRKETSDVTEAAPEHLRRTPVQYEDDGWSDLPVQMRGE